MRQRILSLLLALALLAAIPAVSALAEERPIRSRLRQMNAATLSAAKRMAPSP